MIDMCVVVVACQLATLISSILVVARVSSILARLVWFNYFTTRLRVKILSFRTDVF